LKQLNEAVGVKGSLVLTKDGIVCAAHLARHLDENVVAAMASGVVRQVHRALGSNGIAEFTRFTLVANHGKMVFTDTGPTFLVVVMDRGVELGPVDIEIESAAMRIRNLGKIRV
jgi:predicted regulator of Ras-like GTPase activity (Roadblock/LC7/MglB family)